MFVNSPSGTAVPFRRRPVQERSRQTVERILAAAAQVFGERGYAATTNHVADAAGLSIGSLYQYFPDKDALLVALHERHLNAATTRLVGRGPADDAGAWLQWLVDELTAVSTSPEAQVLWETSRVVPAMRARTSALVDALAVDAAAALGTRRVLHGRAVVVAALALVHEVVLPHPTRTRRQVAIDAVRAVAAIPAGPGRTGADRSATG